MKDRQANWQAWRRLWQEVGLMGDGMQVYERLLGLYSEPYRHYHNEHHIKECLWEFDRVRNLAEHPQSLELAIWFHDAIYDPIAHDNEERSVALAKRELEAVEADAKLIERVEALIMATRHKELPTHKDAQIMVDIDLTILGRDPIRFAEYERQIRQEYSWVPEEVFTLKRCEVLEQFLSRARIYSTDCFYQHYEQQARINLRTSIRSVRSR